MVDLLMVLPAITALLGTIVGAGVTIWVTRSNRKFEERQAYRDEILSNKDDLIKPLFHFLGELWSAIAIIEVEYDLGDKPVIPSTKISDFEEEYEKYKTFKNATYDEMSFLLPSPFPWIFAPLDENLDYILSELKSGRYPKDKLGETVNILMTMQEDLKKLIGYQTDIKLETKYPFEKK